jgi:hypothetical protein
MSDSDEAEMARMRQQKRGYNQISKPKMDDDYESDQSDDKPIP